MYKVKIIKSFSSAHYLAQYKGSCESLHGHNWKVEVVVASEKLNDLGMVIDFRKLKEITNLAIKSLDHNCLNDLDYFKANTPSSENIARYIYNEISKKMPQDCQLDEIRVWETDNSCTSYSK